MNVNISEALLIFIVGETIGFFWVVWKASASWGEQKAEVKRLQNDLNKMGKIFRRCLDELKEDSNRKDRILSKRVLDLEEFLIPQGFVRNSLDLFDS